MTENSETPPINEQEPEQEWMKLRPKDANSIPELRVGRLCWIPSHMDNRLDVNIVRFNALLDEFKIDGQVKLDRYEDTTKPELSIRNQQGGIATAGVAISDRTPKTARSISSEDLLIIQINFDELWALAQRDTQNKEERLERYSEMVDNEVYWQLVADTKETLISELKQDVVQLSSIIFSLLIGANVFQSLSESAKHEFGNQIMVATFFLMTLSVLKATFSALFTIEKTHHDHRFRKKLLKSVQEGVSQLNGAPIEEVTGRILWSELMKEVDNQLKHIPLSEIRLTIFHLVKSFLLKTVDHRKLFRVSSV